MLLRILLGLNMCDRSSLHYGTHYVAADAVLTFTVPVMISMWRTVMCIAAMIGMIHLGYCLIHGHWDALRRDLNLRPVKWIDCSQTDEEILSFLNQSGITWRDVTWWGPGGPFREFCWSVRDGSCHSLYHAACGFFGFLFFAAPRISVSVFSFSVRVKNLVIAHLGGHPLLADVG